MPPADRARVRGASWAPPATEPADIVFSALAEPLRRRLVADLAERGASTATELAPDYDVTRQAVVRHLTALADAGLVTPVRQGREVRYELAIDQLGEAVTWLLGVSAKWDRRLAALQRRLAES